MEIKKKDLLENRQQLTEDKIETALMIAEIGRAHV